MPILAVARLGAGITKDFANQSELARDLMLGAAQSDIRIVQQDLGFALGRSDTLFPDSTIDRLVDFLRQRDGDIYIVLSNQGAVGKSGSTYSNDVSLQTLAHHLREEVQRRFEARDPHWRYQIRTGPDPVNALLCERLHLAPFRFGPDERWPDGEPIAIACQVLDGRQPRLLYRLRQHVSGEPSGVRLHRRRPKGGAGADRRLLDAGLAVVEPGRRVGARGEELHLS